MAVTRAGSGWAGRGSSETRRRRGGTATTLIVSIDEVTLGVKKASDGPNSGSRPPSFSVCWMGPTSRGTLDRCKGNLGIRARAPEYIGTHSPRPQTLAALGP